MHLAIAAISLRASKVRLCHTVSEITSGFSDMVKMNELVVPCRVVRYVWHLPGYNGMRPEAAMPEARSRFEIANFKTAPTPPHRFISCRMSIAM